MTLDVVVTDKGGKPVSGLQESDFKLLDNKQPQKILSFHAVDAASADPPVEVVLVVDEVNMPYLAVARVRDEMEKFLGQNGGKLTRPVSVFLVTDSGSMNRTPPSRDGNALIADLNQADFGLRSIKKSEEGFYAAVDQQQMSLQALAHVVSIESPKPGRKLVVWISPGWGLFLGSGVAMTSKDLQGLFNSVVQYSEWLRAGRITLYQVDPVGPTEGEMQRSDYQQFFKGVKNASDGHLGDLGLQALAYRSGGRILDADNDITGEIATCVGDGNAFYTLTFEALPGDGPNEYHNLEIKLDKPKLTARAEAGYYAQPGAGRAR